ncbi:hypothetical protein GCM10010392_41730 [Streptomyces clavifer]|uniref:Uncharacterized protein n=1 Tax=Streptomyces clavifer TaxID=68188 RepID=A0ABS4VJH0_9ACTN|nr:hypothetical protein [Streptomyces clavifer]GHB09958.1 hypothetical protein GCM10010392_41730 [Streptomyces clavifer]
MQVLARMPSDRVLRRPAPPPQPHIHGSAARARRRVRLRAEPGTWGTRDTDTVTGTRLYGTALARFWGRLHPELTNRASWAAADGTLPIVEGTVIRLYSTTCPAGPHRSRSG